MIACWAVWVAQFLPQAQAQLPPVLQPLLVTSLSGGTTVGAVTYYSLSGITTTASFLDSANVPPEKIYPFSRIDISKSSATTDDTEQRTNMLRFRLDIQSNLQPLQANQVYVAVVRVFPTVGADSRLAAVASAAGSLCGAGAICYQLADFIPDSYSYAVPFLDGMEIGIYLNDICASARTQFNGTDAQGCLNGVFQAPSSGSLAQLRVDFEVHTLSLATAVGQFPALQGSAIVTQQMILKFQQTENSLVCPAQSRLDSATQMYFPGDEQIFLTTDEFGLGNSGLAPAEGLVVAGKLGATPVLDSTYATAGVNDLWQTVGLGGQHAVGGFKNSLQGSEFEYRLGFMVRDATGTVYTNNCRSNLDFQAANIRGFLEKGQCFIATAAYQDPDAAGVRHLRKFRDQILNRFELGRHFVRAYYHYSPAAAEFLLENEWLRPAVLIALVPVQVLAWSLMNPFGALLTALTFGVAAGAALFVLRAQRRSLGAR